MRPHADRRTAPTFPNRQLVVQGVGSFLDRVSYARQVPCRHTALTPFSIRLGSPRFGVR